MEDAFVMNLDAIPGCSVVAVFDGHGGSTVSAYARGSSRRARRGARRGGDGEARSRVFLDLDAALRDEHGAALDQMGSTVVCVLVAPDSLTCGWLGDSRAVLCAGGAAAPLSFDHKPQGDGERARIAAAEGHVFRGRVNGMLAVSRALGDFSTRRGPTGPRRSW
ncbi:protein serine/threonine phosphatase [Aureococcus anophagefferens]|nr:protein serine/threonine phosphatase [Aureococcus anophagefferens]